MRNPWGRVTGYGLLAMGRVLSFRLDLGDELRVRLVADVEDACVTVLRLLRVVAIPGAQAGNFFGVGTHYCNVDRREDPRLLSCGLWAGGVRVYDIRNPWRPTEVAYFNVPETSVPGLTRILVESRELWFSTGSTFYVLRLPEDVVGPILGE